MSVFLLIDQVSTLYQIDVLIISACESHSTRMKFFVTKTTYGVVVEGSM